MSQALGWADPQRMAPFYIDLESPVPPGGVPKPGPLQVSLKNDHLQYAITWFLLAAAVTMAFGFWLRGARRARHAPRPCEARIFRIMSLDPRRLRGLSFFR